MAPKAALLHFAQRVALLLAAAGAIATAQAAGAEPVRLELAQAPSPVDNPLKGLVPYARPHPDAFPHALEFNYLPLAQLVTGPGQYDWAPLERLLDDIASRGHQAIFRVFLEYPGKSDCIPAYLVRDGLKVHRYLNTNTQPFPPKEVSTPDYEDSRLRACLRDYIAALGRKYDGDPRIGYITAGLLGTWGEWHTYPRDDLFASRAVQAEVMDAYEAAFHQTPLLLRYPAGPDDHTHAPNASRPFGYHDDSFAWATLDTGKPEDSWFYMTSLRAAGPEALEKWKRHPIGGEIRPEAWGIVFDPQPGNPQVQDFAACVEATHATWLMDTGMSRGEIPPQRRARAEEAVRRMGYDFHVRAVTLPPRASGTLDLEVELVNQGVAPFYAAWSPELTLVPAAGPAPRPLNRTPLDARLDGLLPGDPPRVWTARIDLGGVPPATYHVLLRVPNPLPRGNPVRFANATQDQHLPGWLTLATVQVD